MDEYLSVIKLIAAQGSFTVPRGWALCNGQILNIAQYNALFALLGITFGGDGRNTFALPDLSKAAPAPNLRYIICINGIFPSPE